MKEKQGEEQIFLFIRNRFSRFGKAGSVLQFIAKYKHVIMVRIMIVFRQIATQDYSVHQQRHIELEWMLRFFSFSKNSMSPGFNDVSIAWFFIGSVTSQL